MEVDDELMLTNATMSQPMTARSIHESSPITSDLMNALGISDALNLKIPRSTITDDLRAWRSKRHTQIQRYERKHLQISPQVELGYLDLISHDPKTNASTSKESSTKREGFALIRTSLRRNQFPNIVSSEQCCIRPETIHRLNERHHIDHTQHLDAVIKEYAYLQRQIQFTANDASTLLNSKSTKTEEKFGRISLLNQNALKVEASIAGAEQRIRLLDSKLKHYQSKLIEHERMFGSEYERARKTRREKLRVQHLELRLHTSRVKLNRILTTNQRMNSYIEDLRIEQSAYDRNLIAIQSTLQSSRRHLATSLATWHASLQMRTIQTKDLNDSKLEAHKDNEFFVFQWNELIGFAEAMSKLKLEENLDIYYNVVQHQNTIQTDANCKSKYIELDRKLVQELWNTRDLMMQLNKSRSRLNKMISSEKLLCENAQLSSLEELSNRILLSERENFILFTQANILAQEVDKYKAELSIVEKSMIKNVQDYDGNDTRNEVLNDEIHYSDNKGFSLIERKQFLRDTIGSVIAQLKHIETQSKIAEEQIAGVCENLRLLFSEHPFYTNELAQVEISRNALIFYGHNLEQYTYMMLDQISHRHCHPETSRSLQFVSNTSVDWCEDVSNVSLHCVSLNSLQDPLPTTIGWAYNEGDEIEEYNEVDQVEIR